METDKQSELTLNVRGYVAFLASGGASRLSSEPHSSSTQETGRPVPTEREAESCGL